MTPEVAPLVACPFCGDLTGEAGRCGGCGRNKQAPRRSCTNCGKFTPSAEANCCHCRQAFTSELAWKVPVIIVLFIAAIVLSVAVRML
ncbi:hypothetical protein [Nannocystis sp.]|uniref:hypothetical protein n=1 Tax=Nannocystis sp. TaxID=1962667 RepID=UPI00242810BE|nr:hypothetical protein [Nannocystis sp.]MBK7829951.1 hypothetical protein [Nannocystis sp.]MBK9757845.1 hypothetical protein [Nannocystis sp.]